MHLQQLQLKANGMNLSVSFYLVYCFITCILKAKVYHCVLKSPAHVKLQRQIVDSLQIERQNMNLVFFFFLCISLGMNH